MAESDATRKTTEDTDDMKIPDLEQLTKRLEIVEKVFSSPYISSA